MHQTKCAALGDFIVSSMIRRIVDCVGGWTMDIFSFRSEKRKHLGSFYPNQRQLTKKLGIDFNKFSIEKLPN